MAGGYLYHSDMCPHPESAPSPLTIYSICQVSYQTPEQNFDNAFDTFFNFVHEDISAMTRIDLDFNVYTELVIEFSDGK